MHHWGDKWSGGAAAVRVRLLCFSQLNERRVEAVHSTRCLFSSPRTPPPTNATRPALHDDERRMPHGHPANDVAVPSGHSPALIRRSVAETSFKGVVCLCLAISPRLQFNHRVKEHNFRVVDSENIHKRVIIPTMRRPGNKMFQFMP